MLCVKLFWIVFYLSSPTRLPQSSDCCGFIARQEIRCTFTNFLVLFKSVFAILNTLYLHMNFGISLSVSREERKACWNFERDYIDSNINLRRIEILITAKILVHKCDTFFFPFILIYFHFSQQCFIVFSTKILHLFWKF